MKTFTDEENEMIDAIKQLSFSLGELDDEECLKSYIEITSEY